MFSKRFRKHKFVEAISEHSFVINAKKLPSYLAVRVARKVCALRDNSFQGRLLLGSYLSEIKIDLVRRNTDDQGTNLIIGFSGWEES